MAPIMFVAIPLVVLLFVLIVLISNGDHYAPQAYYRRKRGGAPVTYGFESLGPRPRRARRAGTARRAPSRRRTRPRRLRSRARGGVVAVAGAPCRPQADRPALRCRPPASDRLGSGGDGA